MNAEINPPSGINVAAIEKELTSLWKDVGGESEQGGVIRACVLNLLVYTPSQSASSEVDEILTEVTAAHPSRAMLIVADRQGAPSSINAWVTSRCTLPTATSKQVCCEQVTITALGDQVKEVPSAVAPLLLSDLPVYLWWRAVPPLADKVFNRLVEISDRVIIDSASFADPHGDLVSLAVLMRERGARRPGLSDLNWARLTPWRALMASFYDVADYRPYLDRLNRVEIEYAPPAAKTEAISPRALLLAGWLAARLGWQLNPGATKRLGETASFELMADGRRISIELKPARRHEVEPGHLAQVTLAVAEGAEASFKITKSADGNRLTTEVALDQERRLGRVLGDDDLSESALIARELEILTHDRVYEKTVIAAGEMVLALVQA